MIKPTNHHHATKDIFSDLYTTITRKIPSKRIKAVHPKTDGGDEWGQMPRHKETNTPWSKCHVKMSNDDRFVVTRTRLHWKSDMAHWTCLSYHEMSGDGVISTVWFIMSHALWCLISNQCHSPRICVSGSLISFLSGVFYL